MSLATAPTETAVVDHGRRTTSNAAPRDRAGARRFACAALAIAVSAWLLAGWAPIGFSIVTVFLFAGPHNWMEGRYLLTRMPGRWGALWVYFTLGIAGVLVLTAAAAALTWLAPLADWDTQKFLTASSLWNTALVLWVLALVTLRKQQNPRREWPWAWPIGLTVIALAWWSPSSWYLGLIYLHPLLALWFLDRELKAHRPQWRPAYFAVLAAVPLLLGLMWWHLAATPNLPGADGLTLRIAGHAGAGILQNVSSHLLVSTHTFLEMLHYGVWLVAIPLVSLRVAPWQMEQIPLAHRSRRWRLGIGAFLAAGLAVVLVLWAAFLGNYPVTRDVYFTVAMLHVLAEAPFLLRLL